jgi:hypothetical protein
MPQVVSGFSISKSITQGTELLLAPRVEQRPGNIYVYYSALIESLRAVVSLPSLGAPGRPPEGLEDMASIERSEAYRTWLYTRPRKMLELLVDNQVWSKIPLINVEPYYEINLMAYLGDQSIARIGVGAQLTARLANAGFGTYSAGDSVFIKGFGIQESFVEDYAPQFAELDQAIAQRFSAAFTRLGAIENRLNLIEPKIESTLAQTLEDGQVLLQSASDINWIRRNWGQGGGGGGDGGGDGPIPLASVGGELLPSIPGAAKFRVVPPGQYKIRVSIDPELLNQVPEGMSKTIEVMSWSEEPNHTLLNTGLYNWNSPGIAQWVADLPRSGGEITITSTEGRKWFGVKVRNSSMFSGWGANGAEYFLDGVFTTESVLAGYSAEWIARSF